MSRSRLDPARPARDRTHFGIYLDRPQVDWTEVRELVTDAYILAAPKRLSKPIS